MTAALPAPSTPAALPTLARWDDPRTTFDGPAVLAAPTTTPLSTFPLLRTQLIWEGHLTPAPLPEHEPDPINRWTQP